MQMLQDLLGAECTHALEKIACRAFLRGRTGMQSERPAQT